MTNIRQTDAIVHVVRCFENPDVIHVDGSVDPIRDVEVINLELILADLEQSEKRLEKCKKDKSQKKEIKAEIEVLEKINEALTAGQPARSVDLSDEDLFLIKSLCLLTLKPVIYAANVKDEDLAGGRNAIIHSSKCYNSFIVMTLQMHNSQKSITNIFNIYLS